MLNSYMLPRLAQRLHSVQTVSLVALQPPLMNL
jgi:hypothetical protein